MRPAIYAPQGYLAVSPNITGLVRKGAPYDRSGIPRLRLPRALRLLRRGLCHRSLGITSNLAFSQWEHIFANPMAAAAAIDRVVHHSVILEFYVPSYRTGVARRRGQEQEVNRHE